MAGLGAESVTPIRPDLATNLQPINFAVEQNAVAAVSQAFRDGQVSANDIIERYSAFAKTKEKAKIQELDEFISPNAIQARQNTVQAANVKAQLESDPLYIESQKAKMQETINAAEGGDYPAMLKVATGLGFFPKNRDATWTDAKIQEAEELFAKSRAFTDYQNQAKAIISDSKLRDDDIKENERVLNSATGQMEDVETVRPRTDKELYSTSKTTGHRVDEDELRAARRAALLTASAWEQSGMPSSPFGEVPGKVAPNVTGRSTTTVTKNKIIVDADGKRTEETTETKTVPEGDTELPIVSRKATPVEKAPTDVQGRAQLGLPRFEEAGKLMDDLKAEGYNPAGNWNSATSFLPGPVKPEERQRFELAKSAFSQGILRLESGAAISVSENKNYGEVFFPKWGDTPAVMQEKENMRGGVAAIAAEIATGGGVASADVKIKADALKARARKIAPGAAASAQSGAGAVETPISTGTLIKKPGGGFTVRAASTNVAPRLPSTYMTPPVVTPR